MRNYLWYKTDDQFGGPLACSGGWPVDADPTEVTPSDAMAAVARANAVAEVDYAGIIAYDCPCADGTELADCPHSNDRCLDSYHNAGVVTAKPATVIDVDLATVTPNTAAVPLDKTPAATVNLKLVMAGVPDGATVDVTFLGGAALHASLPQVLTFTSGETNVLALTAPAQGVVGGVHLRGKHMTGSDLHVRGWT